MNREEKRAARKLVNLDEGRKARAEKAGDPPVVVLNGIEFKVPPSPPVAALVGFADAQDGDLRGVARAIRSLFGDDADKVLELGLDLADLELVLDVYDESEGDDNAGESEASGD